MLNFGAATCRELDDVTHFHVDLYGIYVPGVCSGLSIDIEDLGAPLDPGKYPYITALAEIGIGALYEVAIRRGFVPRDGYAAKCDLCYEIRRWFVHELGVESSGLQPAELYEQMSGSGARRG